VTRFLVRRFFFAVFLVIAVSSAALFLTRLAPGDVTAQLGAFASPAEVARTRAQFDLDRGPLAQWALWMSRAARFDFGSSYLYNRPVGTLIRGAAANTATLAVVALAIATLLGIPLGIVTGSRRGAGAAMIRGASLVFLSIPPLLTSLLLVFIASRRRHDLDQRARHVLVGLDRRRRAAPAAACAGAGAAARRHLRAAAGAVDDRDDQPAVRPRSSGARRARE
jgi:ABC-type dipeptide/oligopeptide/nickel transport system permease component